MRWRIRVLTLIVIAWLVVAASSPALAQGGIWNTKAPMLTPRSAVTAASSTNASNAGVPKTGTSPEPSRSAVMSIVTTRRASPTRPAESETSTILL